MGAGLFHPGSTQSINTNTGPNTSHLKAQKKNKIKKKIQLFPQKELLLWNLIPFPGEPSRGTVGCVLPFPPWGAPPASTTPNPRDPSSPSSASPVPAPHHTLAPCQDSRAWGWKGARGCWSSSCQPCSPKSSAESFKEALALIPASSFPRSPCRARGSAVPAASFFQEKSLPLLFQLISATFQAPAPPKAFPYIASNWDKSCTSTQPCLCESSWLQSLGICGIC